MTPSQADIYVDQTKDENPTDPGAPDIFEPTYAQVMDEFGANCNALQLNTAVAIAVDAEGKPFVFCRGAKYNILKVMQKVYIEIRAQLMDELSI